MTTSTPGSVRVILDAGALTVNLGGIQGAAGLLGGTATITFDVVVVNPLPGHRVSRQPGFAGLESPDGDDPILSDDPGAVVIEDRTSSRWTATAISCARRRR